MRNLALAAIVLAICAGGAAAPAAAQDAKVDIRAVPCSDLDKWDDGDRIAAIFFYYGYHAAQMKVVEVTPANLERNIRNIVEYCSKNPATPMFDAVPKAFQR